MRTLAAEGGHLDWLKTPSGPILFDRDGTHGYFDLWIMNADGSGQRNLTGSRPELPGLHTGQPAWHPLGRLIAFQAQKRGVPREYHRTSVPGAGRAFVGLVIRHQPDTDRRDQGEIVLVEWD